MGIGKPETPKPFVNSCGLFVYTSNLDSKAKKAPKPKKLKEDSDWTETVRNAIDAASQDDEWAYLSVVGNFVHALEPAFDPRTFGYKKLTDLINSRTDLFQVRSTKKIPEVRVVP